MLPARKCDNRMMITFHHHFKVFSFVLCFFFASRFGEFRIQRDLLTFLSSCSLARPRHFAPSRAKQVFLRVQIGVAKLIYSAFTHFHIWIGNLFRSASASFSRYWLENLSRDVTAFDLRVLLAAIMAFKLTMGKQNN